MMEPGGFHRPPGQRRWDTETGKANFINPPSLSMDPIPRKAATNGTTCCR